MFIQYVLLLLAVVPVFANTTIVSKIHDIDFGRNSSEKTLILLESGHVIKPGNAKFLFDRNKTWSVTMDKDHNVLTMNEENILPQEFQIERLDPVSYEPTKVKSGDAKSYFNESRISHGETQCYNRAHVWAFEMWKNHQVKSQKIFLFFTRKYIREHNFGWWFHVAPLLYVDGFWGDSEKVADPRYITAPRDIDWWTGKFISTNSKCPVITKYSEYADYPYSEDCFVLKAPMYMYQPLDLEMQEVWGVEKNNFQLLDVQQAYKEAFQMDYNGDIQ